MARNPARRTAQPGQASASSSVDDMLLTAMERGDESLQTGRYVITFKEGATEEGLESLSAQGLRTADAREFENQAVALEDVGDADAVMLPEIGVAVVGEAPFSERGFSVQAEIAADSPIEAIEPEYFVYSTPTDDFLQGFLRATEVIVKDLRRSRDYEEEDSEFSPQVVGATWGLIACKVPPSRRSGVGIRVAVLDTGMDLGHPDFTGRVAASQTFVGQPVQDLHSHGTHCIGTACGPKAPAGTTPRYGVAYKAPIYVGKVLSNSGSGATGGVLAGMNWAIANQCTVISMSLGSQSPVQAGYTAAGAAALSRGCLIIAAAGNAGSNTGAPANSPTIMSVASLDNNLSPSTAFSNFGKIEISAPGRDVFSSVPRPTRYGIKTGTRMAAPHVAGCAALWAETSPSLRGMSLRKKTGGNGEAASVSSPRVGKGLVQAPP